MNCIIKYKETDNECFCNQFKECNKCNNRENRESEKTCNVAVGGYCTCRTCGYVTKG